jgi:DNA-binding NtrC family response regulator
MNPGGQPVLTLVAIDDDADSLALLKGALKQERLEIVTATDPAAGLELVLRRRPEIVLLDLMMPKMNGMEVLERIVDAAPETNVVLITGHYSTDSAVEAIRKGACDYLTKPLVVSVLRERIGKLVDEALRRREAVELEGELLKTRQFEGMVGGSPLMLQVFDRIRRVAPHFRTVLVRGATGTGKELVATALHRLSPAPGARFAVCNCAAVVESLFESELFGHVKGAFTGASQDKVGLFEYANGGTVFLDEIGDMPLDTQSKLLRVLESGEIQRVGSPVTRRVDVRIVSATNRDLQELMERRKFREDLYYRLSMVEITLPRLAERKEDLPLLEGHFLAQFAEQYHKPIRRITARAQILLARYSWPGNVRELKSVLGSACMMAEGAAIDVRDLPENFRARLSRKAEEEDGWLELADMERRYVMRVLESVNGNKAQAARILGIHRATIYRLLGEAEPEGTSAAKTAGES